jgi:tyrosine phenol-lyase
VQRAAKEDEVTGSTNERRRSWAEPYKIKMVEPIKMTTREEREAAIREAGYNTFLLRSEDVYIDLLTDSGTSAMSDRQWAGMMLGDESYAGSRNFYHLEDAVREIYGYKHLVPTHQGRAAEHLLSQTLIKPGDVIPGNMYFTTTRLHQELAGGRFVDVIIDEAHDPASEHPFKGDVDLAKLQKVIDEVGADHIPYVCIATAVNMAGGQPISLGNLRAVRELCQRHGIRVIHDATRVAENAYFIKEREPGCADMSVAEIVRAICDLTDGCTMSAKKDALVNIGGFLALKNEGWAEKIRNLLILVEGFATYGGLAGRDLEAIAIGLTEVLDEDYLAYRVGQVAYLGELLDQAGVPIVKPVGGHAVYLDARAFLPDVPQSQFPGQALVVALYREFGIRAVEIGSLMFGHRDPKTGEPVFPRLDLVRLAIPRRVYTNEHMRFVAESVIAIHRERARLKGLRITWEAPALRHFTARLEELDRP